MANYTNAQAQALWTSQGGNPAAAAIMGAIAQAESGGNSEALNNNPASGDYSVGLWQINYFGSLLQSRTAAYGSPVYLQSNPDAQAQAAIKISGNGTSFTAWSTYTSGAYLQYIDGASANGGSTGPAAVGGGGGSFPAVVTSQSLAGLQVDATAGFGQLRLSDFVINGVAANLDIGDAIQDIILMRTIQGASTVTIQIMDPDRQFLRANIYQVGSFLTVAGLTFTLVQITKESNTLQFVFEATGIAMLRTFTGATATTTSTNLVGFVQSLISEVPWLGFVAYNSQIGAIDGVTGVSMGRGTTTDPDEDSWTAIQRVVTSAGWRCFEVNNTVYLGPDSFFLNQPSQGTISEFQGNIQDIDFDWDVGKPFGTATVTGMANGWAYAPSNVLYTSGMGPMDGQPWLVQSCQRDLFNPQMTATLYVPQTPQQVVDGSATATEAPF